MKKIIPIVLCVILSLFTVGCSGNTQENNAGVANSTPANSESGQQDSTVATNSTAATTESEQEDTTTNDEANKILIAYFSRTGTTEAAANTIQELTGGDIFIIDVAEPYPNDYNEVLKVAEKEYYDDARPELMENVTNLMDYDVIFLGYPIWYDTAPMVIYTFLESNDLSGKTIVPFCTSGSSGIQKSVTRIRTICPDADVLDGLRVTNNADIGPWLEKISILK